MRIPMFLKDRVEMGGNGAFPERPPAGSPLFIEQFKALRSKIDDHVAREGFTALACTSAVAEEGKTVASVNLALNMVASGRKKILLVDADMRKSDIGKAMKLRSVPGLSEFLSGAAKFPDVVRNSPIPGLDVIPAGAEPPSASDLLDGTMFRQFVKSAKEHFDLILFDTPPVLAVADTLALKEQVDRFILVFRANFTPYTMLQQVVTELGEEKILGVVINRVAPLSDQYYERYYGKYYRK